MRLNRRLTWAAGCLGVTLAAQLALYLHVSAAPEHAYPALARPLADLPLTLRGSPSSQSTDPAAVVWQGSASPREKAVRAILPFHADDMALRQFQSRAMPYPVEVYLVHSRLGEDRKHHPEVCIRDVAGAPEDDAAKKVVYLDGAAQKRPAQRFRVRTTASGYTTVYYWHYTFVPLPREGQTFLQYLHRLLSQPAPSVTVLVSTPAPPEQFGLLETTFLPALDAALQAGPIPAKSLVGCDRLNILVVRQ
ncbi:MAG: hypothetical protein IT429_02360 [Gemmataceae bacterium]|nr:hypothetical protein [Gemmataceae bacterium]